MTDLDVTYPTTRAWVPRLVEPVEPRPAHGLLPASPVTFREGHDDVADPESLAAHLAAVGPRRVSDRHLVDEVEALALTGRGGGHFPAARKWRAVREAVRRTHRTPVVVANAAEGEPASAKDRALLLTRPHLVLDGLASAAEAVDAQDVVLWLHGHDLGLRDVLWHAVRERRALDEPRVRLVDAPAGYLSGETSALVRALSGGPALPRFSLEHATAAGVDGRPTLVHNVETLARVGLLARAGAAAAPRTTLATVVSRGRRTVVEVSELATIGDAVRDGGWPAELRPQAVLLGGYGGRWLPWAAAQHLPLNQAALRRAGASLGAGVLAPPPAGACGLAETARVLRFLADSGARQCGPCLFGLPALADTIGDLARGTARRGDLRRLDRVAAEVSGRGGCHHPDGAVGLLGSALEVFAGDVAEHRRNRPCPGTRAAAVLPLPTGSVA